MIERNLSTQFARIKLGLVGAELVVNFAGIYPNDSMVIFATFNFAKRFQTNHDRFKQSTPLDGMYVSRDGGDEWSLFSAQIKNGALIGISGADAHFMVSQGKQGLIHSTDGGKTWMAVHNQERLEEPAEVEGFPSLLEQHSHLSSEAERGLELSREWRRLNVSQVLFQQGSKSTAYVLSNKGVYRSKDGGESWVLLELGSNLMDYACSVFANNRAIYVGTDDGVLVSTDNGNHFKNVFRTTMTAIAQASH